MADVIHQVEERINVIDGATAPLGKIAGEAEKIKRRFDAIGNIAKGAFGLLTAGIIADKLSGVVHETERYIKNIKEVSELTGATTEQTDFLFSSARKAGVEYDSMQRIMFMMSKRGAMMENSMAVSATGGKTMAKTMSRMGVDMRKGPVTAMFDLAKQVRRGKIDASTLMSQFRVPMGQVNDFKEFLEGLTEAKLQKAVVKGGLVTAYDLQQFNRLEKAQHRLADAWTRIKVVTTKELLPAFADQVQSLSRWLEEDFLPMARRAGEFLRDNMHDVLSTAKKLSAYFAGNKVLQMFFGTSVRGVAAAVGVPGLGAIAAGLFVAVNAFKAIQANVDGVKDRLLDMWANMKARVGLIGDDLNRLWDRVSSIFGVDSDFSVFVGRIGAMGFETIVEKVDGFLHALNTLPGFIGEIADMGIFAFNEMKMSVTNFFNRVDEIRVKIQTVAKVIGLMMLQPFLTLLDLLSKIPGASSMLGQLGEHLKGLAIGQGAQLKSIGSALISPIKDAFDPTAAISIWEKHSKRAGQRAMLERMRQFETGRIDSLRAQRERDAADTDKKPPPNLFDFRGSRFDITQNFAEGYDPDRVAVAFTQDLAELGETKVQSQGFVPLFTMR